MSIRIKVLLYNLFLQGVGTLSSIHFIRFFVIVMLVVVDYTNMHIFLRLFRNIQFFGLESQQKVCKSYVVIIGLGGVGSHAACMLLRSGVGRLLLVDFDQVF